MSLCFYQGLCYESLGGSAHHLASNKTELLQSARHHIILALESLLQYVRHVESGSKLSITESPNYPTFDILHQYTTPQSITPSKRGKNSGILQLQDPATFHIRPCEAAHDGLPDLSIHPPCHENALVSTMAQQFSLNLSDLSTAHVNHKAKLSQSLSSNHVLADELIPFPLFNATHNNLTSPTRGPQSIETPSQSQSQLSQAQRPLPVLPFFNHPPQFKKQGSRYVLVPKNPRARQTAIQTLIAKFEGRLPPASPAFSMTPVTPRFRRISQVFGGGWTPTPTARSQTSPPSSDADDCKKGQGEEDRMGEPNAGARSKLDGSTPNALCTPRVMTAPAELAYISPRSSASYDDRTNHAASLRSFHACLLQHIDEIDVKTAEVEQAQRQRESDAMNRSDAETKKFWSAPATGSQTPTRQTNIYDSHTLSSKGADFFMTANSIAQSTPSQGFDVTKPNVFHSAGRKRQVQPGHDATSTDKLVSVRIQRLRNCGFEVRKERHGWKGQGWYDALRRDVEAELEREGR